MNAKTISLDSLLDYVVTEKGRSHAVYHAVMNSIPVSRENIERALQFYEDKNIFGVVAQLAEHQKDFEKAIQFYEKAREYENAAKLAEKISNLEKALELYKKAAKKVFSEGKKIAQRDKDRDLISCLWYRNAENLLSHAAKLAENMGDKRRALRLYERAGNYLHLIDNASIFHLSPKKVEEYYEKAMQKYEQEADFDAAIRLAERMGDVNKTKKLQLRAIRLGSTFKRGFNKGRFDLVDAARLAKETGDVERANNLYERAICEEEANGSFGLAAFNAGKKGEMERKRAYETLDELLHKKYYDND